MSEPQKLIELYFPAGGQITIGRLMALIDDVEVERDVVSRGYVITITERLREFEDAEKAK